MRFSKEELAVFCGWHNRITGSDPRSISPRDARLYGKLLRLMSDQKVRHEINQADFSVTNQVNGKK